MEIALSLPLFIRKEREQSVIDVNMFIMQLESLKECEDILLVVYNQGRLSDAEIKALLENYKINYDIIGTGENVGIPVARQKCFEHIWNNYPNIKYQGEIHLDMIFYKNWHKPLLDFLEKHKEEPMICPAIVNASSHYAMDENKKIQLPNTLGGIMELVKSLKVDEVREGLVHPAIHNSSALKDIGGIDLRFFKGRQGYEDYSILLGYYNYIGTKNKWKPKICGLTTVFHAVAQQRTTVDTAQKDIAVNEEGLFFQYGSYGFKQLEEMLNDNIIMGSFYKKRVDMFVNWKV